MSTRVPSFVLTLILIAAAIGTVPVRGAYPTDPGPVDATSREAVRQHYITNMVSPDPVPMGYTGDPANGVAGDISADHRAAYLHRINSYRQLAGIPPILSVDNSRNADWQAGAMMCVANGDIAHLPPTSWRFYSASGVSATSTSNIGMGSNTIGENVSSFIWDFGANNTAAGHRHSLLWPDADSVRIGIAVFPLGHRIAGSRVDVVGIMPWGVPERALAISKPAILRVEAWPSAGFFPLEEVPGRWSWYLMPDFFQSVNRYAAVSASTTVSVTRNGVTMPVAVIHRAEDGLVWTLDGTSTGRSEFRSVGDQTFDITISGLVFRPWDTAMAARVPEISRSISYRVIGVDTDVAGDSRIAPPAFAPFVLRAASTGWGDTATVYAPARGATSYSWSRNGVTIPGANSDRLPIRIMPNTIGEYSVVASSPHGQTEGLISAGVYADGAFPSAPRIVTQSASSVTVVEGSPYSIFVAGWPEVGSSAAVPTYQWFKNGVLIAGATSSTRSAPASTLADSGTYTCVLTNLGGSTTSIPISLTVKKITAPVFTLQPADLSVTEGGYASLACTATSLVPFTYQWYKAGSPVPGATLATLSWASVTLDANGTYTCVATNAAGSATSSLISLTVKKIPAPVFTLQPADLSVVVAGPRPSFTVNTTSLVPVTYQWLKDGSPVSGATNWNFFWSPATLSDAGTYTCVATNSAGSTTSIPARLTVRETPPPVFTRQPVDLSMLVDGQHPSFTVLVTSLVPVTFQWLKDGSPVSGATNAYFYWSKATLSDAGTYTCVATSSAGSATSSPARLTVQKLAPPVFAAQPTSVSATVGAPVGFSVTASGFPVPTYQWFKDGVAIAGATGASHVIAASRDSDAGSYTCVITNSGGKSTSTPALLAFGPTAWLSNVSVRTALNPYQIVIVGVTVQGGSKDILVRAVGPTLGAFGVPGTMDDPKVELYRGSTLVSSNDNWPVTLASTFARLGAFACPESSKDAALVHSMDGGYTVQVSGTVASGGVVLVEGYDAGTGSSSRLINLSARNRSGLGGDVLIAGFNIAGSGTKRVLIRGIGPALAAFGVPGTLVDPKLEVFASSGAKIAENDNWDPVLAATFSSVGAFGFPANSKDAALILTLDAGRTYTVQVSGTNNGTGETMIEVYELP